MDVKSFLDRSHLTKADLLRKIGKDPKSSLISAYQSGASNPSFEIAVKLIKLGMTPREVFGEEIDQIFRKHYLGSIASENNDFNEGMQIAQKPMTKEEVIALFKSMKEKGEI
ncbi:MAG: hypothetical protein J6T62_04335 [Fibrobacter sp.]|nr:hypothetical protein [Fibrobacter sp.]MBO7550738.1 hypothetical protein [Fibrobacter sp.]